MSFRDDHAWQMQFLPVIKTIVGPLLIEPATLEVDMKQATDMMLLCARDQRIGCRMRKPGYSRYRSEFTIRSRRDSGAETELVKINRGWGDWMFYGHAKDQWTRAIDPWMVIDLHSFRFHLIDPELSKRVRWVEKSNGDGTYFRAYEATSFVADNPRLLIASSHQFKPPEDAPEDASQDAPSGPVMKRPNGEGYGDLFDRLGL